MRQLKKNYPPSSPPQDKMSSVQGKLAWLYRAVLLTHKISTCDLALDYPQDLRLQLSHPPLLSITAFTACYLHSWHWPLLWPWLRGAWSCLRAFHLLSPPCPSHFSLLPNPLQIRVFSSPIQPILSPSFPGLQYPHYPLKVLFTSLLLIPPP